MYTEEKNEKKIRKKMHLGDYSTSQSVRIVEEVPQKISKDQVLQKIHSKVKYLFIAISMIFTELAPWPRCVIHVRADGHRQCGL